MPRVPGFDHRTGRHCGSAALRNLAAFYDWDLDEPACFGFGTGVAVEYLPADDRPYRRFRPTPPFLERAFLENLEIPHVAREGDDFESAWDDVTEHVDADDPAILHLDPARLPYLPDGHAPPHTAVLVGYDADGESDVGGSGDASKADEATGTDDADEGTALLSDGAVDERQSVSTDVLREAWGGDRSAVPPHRRVVVTRARVVGARRTAATRAVRDCATYLLEPLSALRATGGPGEAGVAALRTFADDFAAWEGLSDPSAAARAALAGVDWHGEGAALRDLYADALEDLAPLAALGGGRDERLRRIAAEWRTVADALRDAAGADDSGDRSAALAEAGSLLGHVADREEAFFSDLRDRLRRPSDERHRPAVTSAAGSAARTPRRG